MSSYGGPYGGHPRAPGRCLAGALVTMALVVAFGAPAWAHAELQSSTPGYGDVLMAAPDRMLLNFSEPMELTGARLSLSDPTGRFQVIAQDGFDLPAPVTMDTLQMSTAQTFDIITTVRAPGRWVFHCHTFSHMHAPGAMSHDGMMAGLVTVLDVAPSDRPVPPVAEFPAPPVPDLPAVPPPGRGGAPGAPAPPAPGP